MIEANIKTEEYREVKPYWVKRLIGCHVGLPCHRHFDVCLGCPTLQRLHDFDYTHVRFHYGYSSRTMLREIESITIGMGKPEWGAPTDRQVFIIKFKKGGKK